MEPFRTYRGRVAPLDRANVDTDQIIPKQFLKRIERTGFGQFLFYDWKQNPNGSPIEDFVLNQPRYHGASILIAGRNFGCGSSREHAAWSLMDFGFRAIIAPSFADIFASNSRKNGLVLVVLPEEQVSLLTQRATENQQYKLTVDLESFKISDGSGFSASFFMDDFARHCLLEGLDDIGLSIQHEAAIIAYEKKLDSLSYSMHTK